MWGADKPLKAAASQSLTPAVLRWLQSGPVGGKSVAAPAAERPGAGAAGQR